jgi:hypothetical protein
LEKLTPIADDDLETAANLLQNFAQQQELIQLIVARVWVRGDNIVAISLRPDYHISIG